MKKAFSIVVDIDTDQRGISACVFPRTDYLKQYTVRIRADVHKFMVGVLETVAHELGHVLGAEFETLAAGVDPRKSDSPLFGYEDERLRVAAMIPSEEEAWDFAELMVPVEPSNLKALATYRGYAARLLIRPKDSGSGWVRLP